MEEKRICRKCNQNKTLSEYHFRTDVKSNGGYRYICKTCACERSRESYQRNKESAKARCAKAAKARILERRKYTYNYFSTHSCVQCGEADPVVLEFDHINPSTKDLGITKAVYANWSWKRLKDEIAKCQVLCANCHRRRTAKQQNWYAWLDPSPNP